MMYLDLETLETAAQSVIEDKDSRGLAGDNDEDDIDQTESSGSSESESDEDSESTIQSQVKDTDASELSLATLRLTGNEATSQKPKPKIEELN
jgi:hypothetical protein